MAAAAESTESPWAESVRTVTSRASSPRSLGSSSAVLSAAGSITSATWGHRQATVSVGQLLGATPPSPTEVQPWGSAQRELLPEQSGL